MGELVSMWPTAGGQYHWTYMLAPEKWKVVLSYVTGWYVDVGCYNTSVHYTVDYDVVIQEN